MMISYWTLVKEELLLPKNCVSGVALIRYAYGILLTNDSIEIEGNYINSRVAAA